MSERERLGGDLDLAQFLPAKPMLVVGGYGYRNAGDEAILAGLLRVTGRDGVTVVSRMPAETRAVHDVRSVPLGESPAAIARHRGLVIGGGGLFGRDMGLLGRVLPLAGVAAAAAGRDVRVLGVGVDREMPGSARRLLGLLGRRARSVVVRDLKSQEILAELGVPAVVAPDLSSLVPSAGPLVGRRILDAAGFHPGRRPVVGVALAGLNPELAVRMEHALIATIDALPEIEFAVLPMSRHPFVPAHNDAVFANRLVAKRPRLQIVAPPDDTAALLGVYEAFSAAVCMRYHSLLFAERAATPIVPVAYAEKCRHWLDERGLASAEPSPEALTAAVGSAIERSHTAAPGPGRTVVAA